jgi:diguanylate cyclase (GGDEF)-like protein
MIVHSLWILLFLVAAVVAAVALALRTLRTRLGWGKVTQEMTDPVTRMFNQHGLRFLTSDEIRRAQRRNAPCSGMLMTMADQSALQGHGDDAIRDVAQALNRTLRASDVAARLEGDRFFVLLPAADESAAAIAMERVRRGAGPALVSSACATLRGDNLTIEALMAACEQQLRRTRPSRRPQIALVPSQVEMGGAQVHPSNA